MIISGHCVDEILWSGGYVRVFHKTVLIGWRVLSLNSLYFCSQHVRLGRFFESFVSIFCDIYDQGLISILTLYTHVSGFKTQG